MVKVHNAVRETMGYREDTCASHVGRVTIQHGFCTLDPDIQHGHGMQPSSLHWQETSSIHASNIVIYLQAPTDFEGFIEADELMQLGKMRESLGWEEFQHECCWCASTVSKPDKPRYSKNGWSEEKNARMLAKMDVDGVPPQMRGVWIYAP